MGFGLVLMIVKTFIRQRRRLRRAFEKRMRPLNDAERDGWASRIVVGVFTSSPPWFNCINSSQKYYNIVGLSYPALPGLAFYVSICKKSDNNVLSELNMIGERT